MMRLVAISPLPVEPTAGPMGFNGSYSGQLAVQLDNGTVVAVGVPLSASSWATYSGGGSDWQDIELLQDASGWLIRVTSTAREDMQPDSVSSPRYWRGSRDGGAWAPLPAGPPIEGGQVVDRFSTPPVVARVVRG